MTAKKIFIRKHLAFVPIQVSVPLKDLRQLVNTRQPSSFLINILAKLGNIDIAGLANVLSTEISINSKAINQFLRSDLGERITALLETIVKSTDPNTSIHQMLLDGIKISLADDGKLSLLEVIENMSGEVVLYVDEFDHFYKACLEGDIANFLLIGVPKKSIISERDILLWHLIESNNLDKARKQRLLTQEGIDVNSIGKKYADLDLESFIKKLNKNIIKNFLEEWENLNEKYSLHSDRASFLIDKLVDRLIYITHFPNNSWLLETGFDATVRAIQFSSDGKFLAAGSDDKSLQIWKTYNLGKSYIQHFKLTHEAEVRAIAFSPQGNILASAGEDKAIGLWNPQTGELIRSLPRTQKYGIFSLTFINEDTLACGSWDRIIAIWNASQGAIKRTLEGHDGSIWSMDFGANNELLASASDDKTVRFWDVETGKTLRVLTGHDGGIFSVRFSPDGRTLATGSWDRSIRIWRVEDGKCLAELKGHEAAVWQVRYTSNGNFLISSADDNSIAAWNLETQEMQLKLEGHQNGVYGLDISPIQPLLVSGSWDKTMRIWKLDI